MLGADLDRKLSTLSFQIEFLHSYMTESSGGTSPTSSSTSCPSSRRERANSTGSLVMSPTPPEGGGGGTLRRRKRNLSCDQQTEILYQEVQAFILAAHLLWCMWGMAHSTNDKIPFGYWVSEPCEYFIIYFVCI